MLIAIFLAQQQKLTSLISARDEELRRLEAEFGSHRQTLSQQTDELRSRSERIDSLKLMVEKLRRAIFGTKSEKILIQLGQLELQLEDEETTHAEIVAATVRVVPAREPKPRSDRKPLPDHLPREIVICWNSTESAAMRLLGAQIISGDKHNHWSQMPAISTNGSNVANR